MALQPPLLPPPPALRSPRTAQYIYQLPSWVLEDFCHKMDSLSEWDWMQFASYVMTDQTQLRKIKSMERIQGVSITRELLWWWGMRQATVQQLLDLLYRLELYRAAQVILDWGAIPEIASASHALPDSTYPGRSSLSSLRKPEETQEKGLQKSSGLSPSSSSGPGPSGCSNQVLQLPFIEEDLPHSLKTNPSTSDLKNCHAYIPQQQPLLSLNGESLYWTEMEVIKATNGFSQENKISQGTFADVYKGQRHNIMYIFKKLQKTRCPRDLSIESFFHMEVQICLSSVLLPMDNTDPLTWEQRISISLGFLGAIEYLHGLKIIHGNIKSSNVLLERNFIPKLGHPRVRVSSNDKKSSYTMMNTQLFQAVAAYVPEDFLRVGQLTERVDIFSCGIVLAEILTSIPAMDKERTPVFLKDLLISEIPSPKALLCSKIKCVEKLAAKEICQKYQDAKAGHLPENCAVDFATAVYLCLQKKNPNLTQVCAIVAELNQQIRNPQNLLSPRGNSELKNSLVNTPEETDDVDNFSMEGSSDEPDKNGLWAGAGFSSPQPGNRARRCLTNGIEADSSMGPGPSHPQDAIETSWEVEVNDAKKKLMENILLYEEEKVNSKELFGSFEP
ncbi:interleukin-1 receptor-associated kinase-like 2 [Gracilinanus agilis]|uniref:interleukin-1 receptor-associated kinase-like 2 n=1 Tax=Gracilinanus agilis TaxID=191870 RepID=UPI001CFCBE05|nr:interleukin-1 receptor-associated kinase-like 2 [Gracilinanus agilis]